MSIVKIASFGDEIFVMLSSTQSIYNALQTVVTCEIRLFWNNLEIISVFHFTCNHVWNWNKIISIVERLLQSFQNYISDVEHVGKYSRAAISLRSNFELISGKFPRAEIKLFQTRVDEVWIWNNFCSHVTTTLTPSTPAVRNCYCLKHPAPYWSNPPVLIFDIRALWRSVLSATAPECQKSKLVG